MNANCWKTAFFALLGFVFGFSFFSGFLSFSSKIYYSYGYMDATYKQPPKYSVNGIKGWDERTK